MKELMDPYQWLPSYGESDVAVRTERPLLLVVTVAYENPDHAKPDLYREIVFDGVTELTKRAFPGLLFDDREPQDQIRKRYSDKKQLKESTWTIGTLGLDESSKRARAWASHFGNTRIVNRYVMHFLSENVEIEVFASGFLLKEEKAGDD